MRTQPSRQPDAENALESINSLAAQVTLIVAATAAPNLNMSQLFLLYFVLIGTYHHLSKGKSPNNSNNSVEGRLSSH